MDLGSVTVNNDPRILPIGGFLRKTKINELPQLLIVLFGDMSLIGPRPLTVRNFQIYTENTQNVIVRVRPGLSGVGSIFFRDEEGILDGAKSSLNFYYGVIAPYKGELEVWYVENANLKLYFKAILMTNYVIFNKQSTLPWIVFRWLPIPPPDIKEQLNFH
jgi:lipopolysaccharide/colanic/teichoic acid biosynthesis glycosyltransferase